MQAQTAEPRGRTTSPPSQRARGQLDRQLTLKQQRFVKAYARRGNATGAAKEAGYKGSDETLSVVGYENLRKPQLKTAIAQEVQRLDAQIDISSTRVQRRLDALSHGAERDGQYGSAVRAEELIGRSINMFVDQSLQLKGNLSADHLDALLQVARARQAQPLNLGDNRITAIMENAPGSKK